MSGPTPARMGQEIGQEIATLSDALAEARRQAEDGAPLDLTGLQDRVSALCALVASLPADAARTLIGPLGALVAALDPLSDALRVRHALHQDTLTAAAEGRSDPHTARHRAAAAYGRGPGAAPPQMPDISADSSDEPT